VIPARWINIGPLGNIPVRGARRLCIRHAGRPIAVFRTSEDAIFALIDECPHKKGPLSEGIVSGSIVTCPLHNWGVQLRDGMAVMPDEGRVDTLPVKLVDGDVHVGLPENATA
jgi:nitrite reductase [NAD(P)H] small subunit